jgi:signal transduction histidine kinase
MWRAITVYRFAALGYAAILMANSYTTYSRPMLGWVVLGVMAAWSVFTAFAFADKNRRRWPLLVADLLVTLACLLASVWVVPENLLRGGSATLPMAWVAAPVLAWAVAGGRRAGVTAALVVGAADLWLRGSVNYATVNATVLLLLAGFVIGYVVHLALDSELRMQHAAELEAATRERERLARGIHDSVLQVLALIARRGNEIGGEAAELGRLASEQESTLRALVSVRPPGSPQGEEDLRESLRRFASPTVALALPATAVLLPSEVAQELAAAVSSALDNVTVHCGQGARAWVLLEEEEDEVLLTVRDEGPGIPEGRLEQAKAEGRLGVAQSITGRLRDVGGSATITSTSYGTEVELRYPR